MQFEGYFPILLRLTTLYYVPPEFLIGGHPMRRERAFLTVLAF
jgi:hypothetical protein